MAKMVRIQSRVTITVTMGLQNKDVSNPDAHIPDRLKVSPLWPKVTVQILEGAHLYPAEIIDWNTVKALEKDEILTIGEITEVAENTESTNLNKAIEEINAEIGDKRKRRKHSDDTSLADLTEE